MAFPDSKLVNAYVFNPFERRRAVVTLKIGGVYLLDRIPRHAEMVGYVLKGHPTQQVHYIFGEAMGITAAARGEGNPLLLVIVAVATLIALYFHADNHLLASYGKADKVTDPVAILHQMTLSAPRTHVFSLFCLDMQNNRITFVFLTGTFMGV